MFCNRTKEFLSQKAIPFEERDVTRDPAALEELQKRRLMTTPVIFVDDEVVVGFDQKKLENLLGLLWGLKSRLPVFVNLLETNDISN